MTSNNCVWMFSYKRMEWDSGCGESLDTMLGHSPGRGKFLYCPFCGKGVARERRLGEVSANPGGLKALSACLQADMEWMTRGDVSRQRLDAAGIDTKQFAKSWDKVTAPSETIIQILKRANNDE